MLLKMEHEEDHKKEEKLEEKKEVHNKKIDLTKLIRKNPWVLSTFVLGIVILLVLIGNFSGASGNVISESDAGAIILDFVKIQTNEEGELIEVNSFDDGLYEIIILYQGQEVPLYLTKNGKNLVQGVMPLSDILGQETNSPDDQQQVQDIPKSNKPEVELFIWSYCPYGVQAQGPLAEVADLIGANADIKAVLYYDGHGAHETQQNKIQACIQEVDKNNYWEYATSFVDKIYPKCGSSKDIECDKTESISLMNSLGIDSSAVMNCVDSKGQDLIDADSQRAKEVGVTGSPSLVINGVKANVARTSEAYKTAICEAFNEAPGECSNTLDTLDSIETTTTASC